MAQEGQEGQEHPISTYLWVWLLLFVLSACSYYVDYAGFQGFTRWFLILMFMVLKAGLIIAVFMHMVWERMALVYFILVPPILLLTFVAIGSLEADWTFFQRGVHFLKELIIAAPVSPHH